MTPPLISQENIAFRDGKPVCLEAEIVAEHGIMPMSLVAFSVQMTPEEAEKAVTDLRAQVAAMSTLMGQEVPPAILEKLEELENDEIQQRAVFGEPFPICWN